jgi:hypothetical protein
MASLVGRSITLASIRMVITLFSEGVDTSTGQSIPDNVIVHYFQAGDELLIRKAKTDMVLDKSEPTLPTVTVSLTVEDQKTKVSARVDLGVLAVMLTNKPSCL